MSAGSAVLWDLDGTLTNSFLGITRTMQHVLRTLGRPVPEPEDLRRFIGPPIQQTLSDLIGSAEPAQVAEAVRIYRERYAAVGKLENELIADIVDALEEVSHLGSPMFVATSKLEAYSIDIVRHFGIDHHFRAIHGSQFDGSRADKGELIAHILDTEGLDPERTIMVGDRLHDVVGARKNGIAVVGVLWGFGDRAELESAGATTIASAPGELADTIAGLLG